jgi:glycosyltransferase involved in cell wall biosynthesis
LAPQTLAPTDRATPQLVSVVVPVLDAAETLGAQLDALSQQDHDGDWEVIVADNGSTDGSREVAKSRLKELPNGRLIDASQQGRGPNFARNAGAREAKGDFLAFCDADDIASPGWLSALVEAAKDADVVAGRLDTERLNEPLVVEWNDTLRFDTRHPVLEFLPFVSTANCGIWADAFQDLGGFREEITRAEDKELAWRAQLSGQRLVRASDAVVSYRYRSSVRASARQHFDYGLAYPALYRLYRANGLPRTSLRGALTAWTWLIVFLPRALWSAPARGLWATTAGQRAGQLVGSIRHRVVFL